MNSIVSKFSKRERLIFGVTLLCIAGSLGYVCIIEPIGKRWNVLDAELESARHRLYKNLKLLADKDLLEKEYGTYQEYLDTGASGEEQVPLVLKEIESIALNSQVKITSIKPKGVKEFKHYRGVSIEVVVEGRISQLLKCIYDIEGSRKLLEVERLVLSPKDSQSDSLKGTLIIRKILVQ